MLGVWIDGPLSPHTRNSEYDGSPSRYYDPDYKDGGFGDHRDDGLGRFSPIDPKYHRNITARPPPHEEQKLSESDTIDATILARTFDKPQHEHNPTRAGSDRHQTKDKTNEMLDLSARNIDELAELHEMMLQEKEYDYGEVPKTADPLQFIDVTKDQNLSDRDSHTDEPATEDAKRSDSSSLFPISEKENVNNNNSPTMKKSNLNSDEFPEIAKGKELSSLEADRLSALERENERLRSEIGAFDSEFFEQLEDLKYRYSRLQEVVGEDPVTSTTNKRSNKLPLDRLSWSVRNSMTAMDRAGLTSPLVNRPRYSNAHTYAPGGRSHGNATGGIALNHPGGIPSSKTSYHPESKSYLCIF